MTLRQLRYFAAVVDWGSLSRAAAQVHVAQPSLSQQVSALEAELGTPLLRRTPQGAEPTAAGERLYRHARSILRQVDEARRDVTLEEAVTGTVSIGLPTSVSTVLALPLLAAATQRLPGIHLRIFESLSGYLGELAARHRLDLAVLFRDGPGKGLTAEFLLQEDLFLVTRRGREEDAAGEVPMAEAALFPMVVPSPANSLRALIDRSFAALGLTLRVVADVDSLPTMRQAAAAGIAATILPMSALAGRAEPGALSIRRLTEPGIGRPISLCHSDALPPSAAAAALAALLREEVRRLVQGGQWLSTPGRRGGTV